MHPNDLIPRFMLAALVAVAALVIVGTAHSQPRCKLGPFTACLKKAVNITLEQGGLSTRVTSASCNRTTTRCELVFARGAFCATVRITITGRSWNAALSDPHDCRGVA